MVQFHQLAVAAALLSSTAFAHNERHAAYLRRQNTLTTTPTPAVTGVPALASITSGMPTATPVSLFTTFTAGATPPISGAPPLPTIAIVATDYPALDVTPPTNGSQIQAWMAKMHAANIPTGPVTKDGSCDSDPELVPNATAAGNCWWTCGGCLRDTDISVCPDENTWGVSYDDGPSDYTPWLLDDLNNQNLHATFYAVGSRVISRPATLQAEYMLGHQVSVHTWSHPPLTSLTNEEIVAELGWTMIAIKNVLGVTPNTFRPPYGDMDDRVRAVAKSMGLTPAMWSSYQDNDFDTDDWRIPGGTANGTSSYEAFSAILDLASKLTTGFIVLEHDLYQETVEMAMGYFLPLAKQRNFVLKAIYECLGQSLASTYMETAGNSTSSTGTSTTSKATGTATQSTGAQKTTSLGAGQTTQTAKSSGMREVVIGFNVVVLAGALMAGGAFLGMF
ncbi:glycoside hydrolase/deacetylase [Clavulina sp. PMI_390]|nr:glycoside hydrolase/deacetylase [Clavulina sp. PMI_390]